jgi:hypothetical protein
MRKCIRKMVMIPVIGLSAAAVAHAADQGSAANQGQGATQATQQGDQARSGMQSMRASKLIGMNVRNAQGEDLGEINDLVVDVNNDRVN